MSSRKTTLFYAVLIAVASLAVGMVIASRLDLSPRSRSHHDHAPGRPERPGHRRARLPDVPQHRQGADADRREHPHHRPSAGPRTWPSSSATRTTRSAASSACPSSGASGRARKSRRPPAPAFIISKDGYILTNNHVVEGATKIEVGFFGDEDGELYPAKIVGRDQLTDSALIQLTEKPKHPLPEAKLGDSSQMAPGDWVMAIGNPFNFDYTISVGVVSAIGRPLQMAEQPLRRRASRPTRPSTRATRAGRC